MKHVLQHFARVCEQVLDHESALSCFVSTDLPVWTRQTIVLLE